jgi:hypothetical protein
MVRPLPLSFALPGGIRFSGLQGGKPAVKHVKHGVTQARH